MSLAPPPPCNWRNSRAARHLGPPQLGAEASSSHPSPVVLMDLFTTTPLLPLHPHQRNLTLSK